MDVPVEPRVGPDVAPGIVPGRARPQPEPVVAAGGWAFGWQVISGVAVIALVTLHMIAHHFVVASGLRFYTDVIEYITHPVILTLEVLFLVFVTWHALLGVRAILFDFGFSSRTERRITWALVVLGAATVVYGLWLTATIAGQG